MPLHSVVLTVPPNTSEAAPASVTLKVGRVLVETVTVIFPDGCLNAVGIRLKDGPGAQFAPRLYGWVTGNNESIGWVENYRLNDWREVVIEGYNLAVDWPHSIGVRLTTL